MIAIMERNRKAIQNELGMLAFYMQGGLGFDEAHLLTADQRRMLSRIIEKHFEASSGKSNSKLIG